MTLHKARACAMKKIRVTLCGRRGAVYTHKSGGRLYCQGDQGRFRIAGKADTVNCWHCERLGR